MKSKGSGSRGWGLAVLVGLGFASVFSSTEAFAGRIDGSNQAGLTFSLHVFDYAQVEPGDLARAEDEVTRIFRVVGLETVWHECVMSDEGPQGEACRGQLGPGELVLRILPRAMAERVPMTGETFGFAQQSTDDHPSYVASVFYHRVERLADDLGFARSMILGHALAHEIGHLLLGTDSHAPLGIMRASWKRRDLINASMGGLVFLPQQAARIRAEVEHRTGVHENPQLQAAARRP
jgi:hypothetical protein